MIYESLKRKLGGVLEDGCETVSQPCVASSGTRISVVVVTSGKLAASCLLCVQQYSNNPVRPTSGKSRL